MKRMIGTTGCALLAVCASAVAGEENVDSLKAQIASLQERLSRVEATSSDAWLSDQRSEELRSIVQDVIADADTRSSMLQGGAMAGWDNGFFIASGDGNFKLGIGGVLQFKLGVNLLDENSGDSTRLGWEARRTTLKLAGHVVDPSWTYCVHGIYSVNGGGFGLLDAIIGKDFGNGWGVRMGQFKHRFLREQFIGFTHLQAVDRSLVQNYFGIGRTEGVELYYHADNWKFSFSANDGANGLGGNTNDAMQPDAEWGFTGRFDYLVDGVWGQFNDYSGWASDEYGLLIGAALHAQSEEYGTGLDDNEVMSYRWTVDVAADFSGASLSAAFMGLHTDNKDTAVADVDQYGFVLSGGYFLNDDWELFGRWEWADDDTNGTDDLSIITIGAVRYFAGHRVKWTNDFGYGINGVGSMWVNGPAGYRLDTGTDDGQIVIRSQMQLVF